MKFRTLVFGYAIALAAFVFAEHHTDLPQPAPGLRAVVDLTHSLDAVPARSIEFGTRSTSRSAGTEDSSAPPSDGTFLESPASLVSGLWTVDQIPANRLLAPLVVLDMRSAARLTPDHQISVEDIAVWEHAHGEIPPGACVIAWTGWESRWNRKSGKNHPGHLSSNRAPGYSADAAKFLVEGRTIFGLGIDTASVSDIGSKGHPIREYILAHSVYQLTNVANLASVPESGSLVLIAPSKLTHATSAPARMLAMVN